MRAHAATQVTLTRFGAWRWAVFSLSAALALLSGTWVGVAGSPAERWAWPAIFAGLTVMVVWLVAAQPRAPPLTLAWDGQRWRVGIVGANTTQSGDLHVAIDLGLWMLLKFTADESPRHRRVRWIAAQRAGHESQWHLLRCAVYSPRPDAGADAAPDV